MSKIFQTDVSLEDKDVDRSDYSPENKTESDNSIDNEKESGWIDLARLYPSTERPSPNIRNVETENNSHANGTCGQKGFHGNLFTFSRISKACFNIQSMH